ncbi:hypothetical protein Poli38472_014716 [Pythium oligandrum]|uniref:Uncharacterized protein n=1 Tax=Pythium oligandrum TaxID=41045 RepID=A0A8K1F977_PYTOL|nr:hypothetical protein Poli38472_014716 [Pythium oligandrum]|eukprot:TMW54945.1 hypothetical protein Poli38472_014716 [Pythium oligandrum]
MARVAPHTSPTDNDIQQQQIRAPSASGVHPVASIALASLWPLRVYWLAIVTMHLLVGAYFLLYAATYRYFASNPQTVASYLLGTVQESTEHFHTPVQGVSLAIVAAHALVVLKAIVCSVWSRDLVFSPPPGNRWFMTSRSDDDSQLRSFSIKRLMSPRLSMAWATIKRKMPSELEMLQVTNTVEVALQAYQANKISHLVAKPWINRLMVAAIVLNCWTIPIVNFWYRRKSSSRLRNLNDVRSETLAKLLLDALVDTVYGIAVPSAIFYPYATTIDLSTGLFPPNPDFFVVWRTDMWATANQFLVSSYVDLASKMMPGVTLLFGLWSMQRSRPSTVVNLRLVL